MNEQLGRHRQIELHGITQPRRMRISRLSAEGAKRPSVVWERYLKLDRVSVTVLFTDIVDSTARIAALGDHNWHLLLDSHHALVRRSLARFHGHEIDTTGDGFFAAFECAINATRCACNIVDSVYRLGIQVRAGLHTGDCEVIDAKLGGLSVHICARIVTVAVGGEVLISDSVRDRVADSGVSLVDRGNQSLKGIPGQRRLYAICREPPIAGQSDGSTINKLFKVPSPPCLGLDF